MTDTILERAANAIANELLRQEPAKGGTHYVDADDLSQTRIDGDFDLRAVARAVLQAIREPSEAMLEAAQIGDAWNADDPEGIWSEMIDAALSENRCFN